MRHIHCDQCGTEMGESELYKLTHDLCWACATETLLSGKREKDILRYKEPCYTCIETKQRPCNTDYIVCEWARRVELCPKGANDEM